MVVGRLRMMDACSGLAFWDLGVVGGFYQYVVSGFLEVSQMDKSLVYTFSLLLLM